MEVKEGIVLSPEGKTIPAPEGARRAAEEVVFRYRKLGGVPKLVVLPVVVIALFLAFSFLAAFGLVLALRSVKRLLIG